MIESPDEKLFSVQFFCTEDRPQFCINFGCSASSHFSTPGDKGNFERSVYNCNIDPR
jgi:hypothetical protein